MSCISFSFQIRTPDLWLTSSSVFWPLCIQCDFGSFSSMHYLSLWWLNPESLACSVTILPLSFYHHSASLPPECSTGNTDYFCQSLHLTKMCGSDTEVDMVMSDLLFFILRELSSQTQTSFPKHTIATN